MALENHVAFIVFGIFLQVLSRYVVVGSIFMSERTTDAKTVRTEYGNIYDCVSIYKQPSLDHPLLKDHKIQLRPPSFASKKDYGKTLKRSETLKNICRPGTVPIPRTREPAFHLMEEADAGYHFAGIHTKIDGKKIFRGAEAHMSIYNPKVGHSQSSGALISIQSGPPNELNSIKVGWVVDPDLYGNTSTRLFTSWKANNAGCCNLQCMGFVQMDHSTPIDSVLVDISDPQRKICEYPFGIQQDKRTGHWWFFTLAHDGRAVIPVGYWPRELFTHLNNGAEYIQMAGQVHSPPGDSTYPPMGNGLPFGNKEFLRTSYFSNIVFLDHTYTAVIPDNAYIELVSYRCFLVGYNSYKDTKYGYSFVFGGPGGNDLNCLDKRHPV